MKFTFIAVNFNGSTHTANYLRSLADADRPDGDTIEVIIVDNNSNSADIERLRQSVSETPGAKLIALDSNPGYFSGLNAGISACRKDQQTLLIVGNNDLIFDRYFLTKLKKVQYDDDVLVIAPNITTLAGRRQNPHVLDRVSAFEKAKARIYFTNYHLALALKRINSLAKAFIQIARPVPQRGDIATEPGRRRIKRGIGACYVLTPHFFRHFDRLDDRVFLWGEEALLSHQIETVKGSTLYEPSIRITHCESASVSSISSREKYETVRRSYKIYREYL